MDFDYSGKTRYFDHDGKIEAVGPEGLAAALEDKTLKPIATTRFRDTEGNDYYVPNGNEKAFLYGFADEEKKRAANKQPAREVAQVQTWKNAKGESYDVANFSDPKKSGYDTQKMRADGFKPAEEWDAEDTTQGWSSAVMKTLTSAEPWQDVNTETVVRGTAAGAASIGAGLVGFAGDQVVNAANLALRTGGKVLKAAGALGELTDIDALKRVGDVGRAMTESTRAVRGAWEGVKAKTDEAIMKLAPDILRATEGGKLLAKGAIEAGKMYGEMGLGFGALAKAGGGKAVAASFGLGGFEQAEEEQAIQDAGIKGDIAAIVDGVGQAFGATLLGKTLGAVDRRFMGKAMEKTVGAALKTFFGSAIKGGVDMGVMQAPGQVARQILTDEKTVDPVTGEERSVTWTDRMQKVASAMLNGTIMTASLKATEVASRAGWKWERQGREAMGIKTAMTLEVERNRREYAPYMTKRAETASMMARAGMPVAEGGYGLRAGEIKGVSTNGEVFFQDGSVYYPETLDAQGKTQGARIVVSDGTILDTSGNVVGIQAGEATFARPINNVAEQYARATDPTANETFTGINPETGDAGPITFAQSAPQSWRDYAAWVRGGKQGAAPKLTKDAFAFSHLFQMYKSGGSDQQVAELALGDVIAGRKTWQQASRDLGKAEQSFYGESSAPDFGTRDSGDTKEERQQKLVDSVEASVRIEPAPTRPNGAVARKTVDAAVRVVNCGEDGEMALQDVTIAEVARADAGLEQRSGQPEGQAGQVGAPEGTPHGPIIVLRDSETGKETVIDGQKRIDAEAATGAKTVKAIVLETRDGWNADGADAVKAIANLRSGTMGIGDMVRAFRKLGLSEQDARDAGLLAPVTRQSWEEVTPEYIKAKQFYDQKMAAFKLAMIGSEGLAQRANEHNLQALSRIAERVNVDNWGEGWQSVQDKLADQLGDRDYHTLDVALDLTRQLSKRVRNGRITSGEIADMAAWLVSNHLEGERIVNEHDFREMQNRMASDPVGTTPVADGKGGFKTLNETEAQGRGEGQRYVITEGDLPPGVKRVNDWQADQQPSEGAKLIDNGDGTFGCAKYPGLRIFKTEDGGAVTVNITGIDHDAIMQDPMAAARTLGEIVEKLGRDQVKVETGSEALVQQLLDIYDEAIKKDPANVQRANVVMGLLEKSGLANGIVMDRDQFLANAGNETLQQLRAGGILYGYADPNTGKVYLNPDFFASKSGYKTPIHEFGHLAVIQTKAINRALYDRGMELIKDTQLYRDVLNNAGYDELKGDAAGEEMLRQEALVRLVESKGELLAKEPESIKAEILGWLKEMWKAFGRQIGIRDLTEDDVNNMTLDQIAEVIRNEMVKGAKFGEVSLEGKRPEEVFNLAAMSIPDADPKAAQEKIGIPKDAAPVDAGREATEGGTVIDGMPKQYSIKSLKYDLSYSTMISDLVRTGVFTKRQALNFKDNLNKLIDKILPHAFMMDLNETFGREDRPFTPIKPNSDPLYKLSLDFSTLCKKRLLTQYVIEQLQTKQNRVLRAEEQMAVRDMLLDYQKIDQSLQVACHLCYVEAARLKAPKQIDRFFESPDKVLVDYFAKKNTDFAAKVDAKQRAWKKKHGVAEDATKDEMKAAIGAKKVTEYNNASKLWRQEYKPTAEEMKIVKNAKTIGRQPFLTAENLTKLAQSDPEIFEAYSNFVRTSTHSKGLETDVPYYYGDSKVMGDAFIKNMNEQGTGMRHQSWSDFQMRHLLDTIVAVADLSVRGAKMHAYTKVPAFAECMGKTGIMINLSLMPNVNGVGFSSKEGIDYNEAKRLREKFPETCGTIAIAIDYGHLVKMVNDQTVDYVIPYHSSGLNKSLRKMVGINGWTDFTQVQHEKNIEGARRPEGIDAKDWQRPPEQGEWLVKGDGNGYELMAQSARRYVQLCNERGLKPKFADVDGLLIKRADGTYEVKNENYWKLLIDHKMVNQKTERLIEQKAVRPDFDFKEINRQIDKEVKDYDPDQFSKAYDYVKGHIGELGDRVKELKKTGAAKALLRIVDEANPIGQKLFLEGVNGKWRNHQRREMTDADFEKIKGTPEALPYSFNGLGRDLAKPGADGRDYIAPQISRVQRLEKLFVQDRYANLYAPEQGDSAAQDKAPVMKKITVLGGAVAPATDAGAATKGGKKAADERYWEDEFAAKTPYMGVQQPMSLGVGETVRLTEALTGKLPVSYKRGKNGTDGTYNRKRNVVGIAKDMLRVVDQTDVDSIKGQMKQQGYFNYEDPAWVLSHTDAEVAQDKATSDGILDNRVRVLLRERVNGTVAGSNQAAAKVMANQLGRLVMDMPIDLGPTSKALRTLGEGIMTGFGKTATTQAFETEAAQFFTKVYGKQVDPADVKADLRGSVGDLVGWFLNAPDLVEREANGIFMNIRTAIASNKKLSDAWNDLMATKGAKGGAAEYAMQQIEKNHSFQRQLDIERLEQEINTPIGTRAQRFADSTVFNWSNERGPLYLHMGREVKAKADWYKKLLRKGRLTQAQYDALVKRDRDLVQSVKLAQLAADRGMQNEIRAHLWDLNLVFQDAMKKGVQMNDLDRYMYCQRVIETNGRSGEGQLTDPRYAKKVLEELKSDIGGAKWAQLVAVGKQIQAAREQNILEDDRLVAAFGQRVVDYWKSNAHYVRTERTIGEHDLEQIEMDRKHYRQHHTEGDDIIMAIINRGRGFGNQHLGYSTWTKSLQGSFRPTKDWKEATARNDMQLMAFMERNDYVLKMRDALEGLGVEGVHDLAADDKHVVENDRYGVINYVENGKRKALVVPKIIADGYKGVEDGLDGWNVVGKYFHGALIDWNLLYAPRNFTRNLHSAESNLEGMAPGRAVVASRYLAPGVSQLAEIASVQIARHLPDWVFRNKLSRVLFGKNTNQYYAREAQRILELYLSTKNYQKRKAEADAELAQGDPTKTEQLASDLAALKFIMKGNALISRWDQVHGGEAVDDFMKSNGLDAIIGTEVKSGSRLGRALKAAGNAATWIFRRNAEFNRDLEIFSKISASLQQMAEHPNASAQEIGQKVAAGASIPQYENKGSQAKFINYAWNMFFNTALQGTLRHMSAIKERPGETLTKMAVNSIGPRVFWSTMVLGGGIAALIRQLFDGDEEKIKASRLADLYEGVQTLRQRELNNSAYQHRYYKSMPIASWGNVTLNVSAPLTDEEKLYIPLVDYATSKLPGTVDPTLTGGETLKREVVGTFVPDISARTPPIAAAQDLIMSWWTNPYDSYRGTEVYNKDLWNARTASASDAWEFFKATVKQTVSDLGGRTILPVGRNNVDEGGAEVPESVNTMLRGIPYLSAIPASVLRLSSDGAAQRERVLNDMKAESESVMKERCKAIFNDWLEKGYVDLEQADKDLDDWTKRYGWDVTQRMDVFKKAFNAWTSRLTDTPELREMKLMEKTIGVKDPETRKRYEHYLTGSWEEN